MTNLRQQIDQLRRRFALLAEMDGVAGMQDVATGLEQFLHHLEPRDVDEADEQLLMLVHGLSGLANFLDPGSTSEAEDRAEGDDAQGLDQFLAIFKKDASKRLRGLSISLMGIFGDKGSEQALQQSMDHFHAIRGSAAMLGLKDIAELSAALENSLSSMAKIDPDERQWPTKTILRGFALLEAAINSNPPALSNRDEAEEILDILGDTSHGRPSTVDSSSAPKTADEPPQTTQIESKRDASSPDLRLEQPILIVDDVDTIAASVGFILSELEVPIEIASNGQEAIQMLQEKPFSLVVSDVDMPRMDGIALTKMIRSSEQWSKLPVILLTSLDHPEERQAGMDAGATDYLIKGAIGGGELLRRVRELLSVAPVVKRRTRRRQRRILVAEDTETVAASIAFVLSEGPFEIVLATDGKDALRHLKDNGFDLLITDMQMPYMTGTELVASVRSDESTEDLPVIMLTSVDDQKMAREAFDAGVDRYLLKGEIAGGKLLSVVEELLPHS